RCGWRAGGVEALDQGEPLEHCGCFLHDPRLAARKTRVCAEFVSELVTRPGEWSRLREPRAVPGRARVRAPRGLRDAASARAPAARHRRPARWARRARPDAPGRRGAAPGPPVRPRAGARRGGATSLPAVPRMRTGAVRRGTAPAGTATAPSDPEPPPA